MPRLSEDWLAVLLGGLLLAACLAAVLASGDASNPLSDYLKTPQSWTRAPGDGPDGPTAAVGWTPCLLALVFAAAVRLGLRGSYSEYIGSVFVVLCLATLALTLGKQQTLNYYGLGYALWAILIGLAIANTVGTPGWLRPAVRTELYMKVGLVLLGAEVLLGRLLALGPPGVGVAWVVTPIVLCTTFWFGQRVLRIESPSLNMVVSADMSVCGVSAAIATAAACRAKKEELSLAIGLSMAFTVVMMLAMPPAIRALGLPPAIGGAWIGGTIDSTGAVGAAGALLGEEALQTAVTIKMIQNVLIGVVAFGVAVYWVTTKAERVRGETESAAGEPSSTGPAIGSPKSAIAEVWRRFPKFILGFLGASVLFSMIASRHADGEAIVDATIQGGSKTLRTWCFALAFVSIGLETNFRTLAATLRSGKPLVLYLCGQTLNLSLTLAMAWLMFGVVFPVEPTAQPTATPAPTEGESPAQRLADSGVDPGALFYTDHPRATRGWEPND